MSSLWPRSQDRRRRGLGLCLLCGAAAGLAAILLARPGPAQQAADEKQTAKPAPQWSPQCTAPSRDRPLDCQIQQRAVITETGQLLFLVTVRVPGETKKPVLMIQAPLSMFLPEGVMLNVDGQNQIKLGYQTCDTQGCYAATPVSDDLLQAMLKGLKLNLTIQSVNRKTLTVPMSLVGFSELYGKIK